MSDTLTELYKDKKIAKQRKSKNKKKPRPTTKEKIAEILRSPEILSDKEMLTELAEFMEEKHKKERKEMFNFIVEIQQLFVEFPTFYLHCDYENDLDKYMHDGFVKCRNYLQQKKKEIEG